MHSASRWTGLALLLGSSLLAAPDAGTAPAEPVDATEGCTEFWTAARGATPDQRVEAFDRLLRQRHPDLYTAKVLSQELGRSRSLSELARMPPEQARVEVTRLLTSFAQAADGGFPAPQPRRP